MEALRAGAPGHYYATSMAPPAAQQIIGALRVIRGEDGSDRGAHKIVQLHDNSNYFRRRLLEMGCNVLGDWDSPVMVRVHTGMTAPTLVHRRQYIRRPEAAAFLALDLCHIRRPMYLMLVRFSHL